MKNNKLKNLYHKCLKNFNNPANDFAEVISVLIKRVFILTFFIQFYIVFSQEAPENNAPIIYISEGAMVVSNDDHFNRLLESKNLERDEIVYINQDGDVQKVNRYLVKNSVANKNSVATANKNVPKKQLPLKKAEHQNKNIQKIASTHNKEILSSTTGETDILRSINNNNYICGSHLLQYAIKSEMLSFHDTQQNEFMKISNDRTKQILYRFSERFTTRPPPMTV